MLRERELEYAFRHSWNSCLACESSALVVFHQSSRNFVTHSALELGSGQSWHSRTWSLSFVLIAVGADFFPLFLGVEDFAGLGAVVVADDAVFGHVVDHSGCSAIADPKATLKQ